MTTDAVAAAPPLCAQHPDLPSLGTCARCGRFACEQCFQPESGLCAECSQRTADPLGVLGPFSVGQTLASGWKLLAAARWTALGASVGMTLASVAFGFITARVLSASPEAMAVSRSAGNLIHSVKALLLGTWIYGALLAQMAAAARGEPISAWRAVARSARAWPRMVWAQFVASFIFLLGLAALVIPGFYAAVALWLVMPAAYLEPGEPALRVSSELTRGRRWEVLALALVARGPILLLAGIRYAMIFFLVRTGFRFAEREAVFSVVSLTLDVVQGGAESFEHALTLAAYLKLRRAATLTG
ncbi:MAG TPA: hypothetical protein VFA20_09670 [Myxococcaceae bacterium]|nr:hypothetical protein [Myxococcaceae bacterium]